MKLEDQVCSLELSRRLKELRVKQESLWWWGKTIECGDWAENYSLHNGVPDEPEHYSINNFYSAYTAVELGAVFKENEIDFETKFEFGTVQISSAWAETDEEWIADTEANARAKMLIYLIENNLINQKEK